ncbi:MAG: phosphoserine phosphatase SerB [Zetaproteobacteria bacterium]|nr:phosphoserine phosphatase SerB [Zetaproteobacteria bacterium]
MINSTLPPTLAEPGILFMDMDSTLIQCECIDEIADLLGIKSKIAAITQRAMEGKLDFSASLIERVALLKGLDAALLEQVYVERIQLTDGAENLINTVKKHGWKVGLVSGGFTYFTDKLQTRLGLDFVQANVLGIENNQLTGKVIGSIVDAQSKKEALIAQAARWHIPMSQTVALGDGANDLPMLTIANMGIAFHAKPAVQAEAKYVINSGPLDQTLALLRK